ncbi:MAG TPA: cadherin repeat domain-containing protein, partial [Gemmatimonadaceae bacterium]|nr:cadherin repeat domain-containing protein [Gemmatimonadaceae bacterium]
MVVSGSTSSARRPPRDITASAGNGDGPITYSLVDDAGGRFAIDPATGVVTVANGGLLDFETATG